MASCMMCIRAKRRTDASRSFKCPRSPTRSLQRRAPLQYMLRCSENCAVHFRTFAGQLVPSAALVTMTRRRDWFLRRDNEP